MPALPDVPKVIRFDMHFDIGEDNHAKCRFFRQYSGGAPTVGELNTMAAAVMTSWGARLAAFCSPDRILTEVDITDLSSAGSAAGSALGSVPGTNVNASLPASMCVLESLHLTRRYRGGHPRIYWPIGTEVDLHDQQTWSAAAVASWGTALSNFANDIAADTWSGGGSTSAVSVSFYNGFTVHTGTTGRARNVSTPRVTALIDAVPTSTIRQGIASQRKRLLRLA